MNRYNTEEPDTRGAAVLILICFIWLLAATAFGAWVYFQEPGVVTVEIVSEEGVAKAYMINELTGKQFPPEIAKWANVTFSGTSVSIDTESLNIWLGKNWKEKVK